MTELRGRHNDLADLRMRAREAFGPDAAGEHRYHAIPLADWIHDVPDTPEVIWGDGSEVVWASGELLLAASYTGVGKTTLLSCVIDAATGQAPPSLLGYPFGRTFKRVLLLALDRPRQIRRAMQRHYRDVEIGDAVHVLTAFPWRLDADPSQLASYLARYEMEAVFIDSVKDLVTEIDKPAGAEIFQRAVAACIGAGIEVMALTHVRKPAKGWPTLTMNDLYGGGSFAWSAGSIVLLQGPPGAEAVSFEQVKSPVEPIVPFRMAIDKDLGTLAAVEYAPGTALSITRAHPEGVTASFVAAILGVTERHARRQLNAGVDSGDLARLEGLVTPRGREPTVWTAFKAIGSAFGHEGAG